MNKYQVLTAASCVSGRKKELLFVLAEIRDGSEIWVFSDPPINWNGHPYYRIKSIKIHEDYDKKEKTNDIALITVNSKKSFEDQYTSFRAIPVELPGSRGKMFLGMFIT